MPPSNELSTQEQMWFKVTLKREHMPIDSYFFTAHLCYLIISTFTGNPYHKRQWANLKGDTKYYCISVLPLIIFANCFHYFPPIHICNNYCTRSSLATPCICFSLITLSFDALPVFDHIGHPPRNHPRVPCPRVDPERKRVIYHAVFAFFVLNPLFPLPYCFSFCRYRSARRPLPFSSTFLVGFIFFLGVLASTIFGLITLLS